MVFACRAAIVVHAHLRACPTGLAHVSVLRALQGSHWYERCSWGMAGYHEHV